MTPPTQTSDTRQLSQRTDSPMVGNAIVEFKDVVAGDSLVSSRSHTSARPGSSGCTAETAIGELASNTPLLTPDSDALVTLPKSLRARWQRRYGNWLAASDVIVVTGVVGAAHILRFGNVTRGSLWAAG